MAKVEQADYYISTDAAGVVRSLNCVQFFATPWTAACQVSLSFTISQCLLKLMSIELVIQQIRVLVTWC